MEEALESSAASLFTEDVVAPLAGGELELEVVLEAALLKHSRNRQWNERYFVFDSEQKLTYYDKKGDRRPKATFRVTRDSGCEISDLYVAERQKGNKKESLYCFTITWPDDPAGSIKKETSMHDSLDDMSYLGLTSAPPSPTPSINNSASLLKTPARARKRSLSADDPLSPRSRTASPIPKNSKAKASMRSTESSIASGCSKTHRRHRTWLRKDKDPNLGASMPHLEGDNALADPVKKTKSRTPLSRTPLSLHRRRATANDVPLEVKMDIGPPPLASSYENILERGGHALEVSVHGPEQSKSQTLKSRAVSDNKTNGNKGAYDEQHAAEQDKLHSLYVSTKKEKQKESRKKMLAGTKIFAASGALVGIGVLTYGVGLAAGLVFLGATAAAGGTAGAAEAGFKRNRSKRGCVTIATKSYEDAKLWKSTLDACLEVDKIKQSTWGQMFMADGRKTASALVPRDVELMTVRSKDGATLGEDDGVPREFPRQTNLFLMDRNFLIEPTTRWRPLEGGWTLVGPGAQGLRILKEERTSSPDTPLKTTRLAVGGTTCPLKSQVVVRAHPLDAFMCLMSYARIPSSVSEENLAPCSGQRASFRTIEKIDDHMDVVHLVCRKMYLFPSWTVPRDFVLFRYWRYEPDGSYIVCYESMEHAACPPNPRFVRGEMHQVCTIAPSKATVEKRSKSSGSRPECLMTSVVQVDPKGWVPSKPMLFLSNQGYGDAFGVAALLQLLDIRDAIEVDRFLDVAPDISHPIPFAGKGTAPDTMGKPAGSSRTSELVGYDFRYANRERCDSMTLDTVSRIEACPKPLDVEKWAEPDANSFLVRGPMYKKDRVKVNAGRSIGQLIAVDVVQVDKLISTGMSKHPYERIQLALRREKLMKEQGKKSDMPPFIFVVNIMLPGPPFYHGVFYYAVEDMSSIDGSDGTASSRLANKFLFGDSDEFRDRTFKLIPQIVAGNFMVRKAVGSTPAIMGTKLKQTYVRDKRFMEVVLDCGSSAVATGVIRLTLGYAKTLAVDMGFLLEGDDEDHLPEKIFGCVRMKFPDFGPHLRKVAPPTPKQPKK
jgi:hypothetical protein